MCVHRCMSLTEKWLHPYGLRCSFESHPNARDAHKSPFLSHQSSAWAGQKACPLFKVGLVMNSNMPQPFFDKKRIKLTLIIRWRSTLKTAQSDLKIKKNLIFSMKYGIFRFSAEFSVSLLKYSTIFSSDFLWKMSCFWLKILSIFLRTCLCSWLFSGVLLWHR